MPKKNQVGEEDRIYAEVWGDRVDLKQLAVAAIIGVVLTMACYLIASHFFLANKSLDDGLAKGYSLMVGIAGCIASGAISSVLFKPKRIIVENSEEMDIEGAVAAAGRTLEEEIEDAENVPQGSIDEMESMGLDGLLHLRELHRQKSVASDADNEAADDSKEGGEES